MTKEYSVLRQFLFGSDLSRAWREERVLRYIIHRIDEDAELHEVLEEPYVQRNSPRLKSTRFGATPNSSMPVGSTWSRHSVRKSWTPGGTEPLASSVCEAGADHVRAGSPTVARTLMLVVSLAAVLTMAG